MSDVASRCRRGAMPLFLLALAAITAGAFGLGLSLAAGVPDDGALRYAGAVQDATGNPIDDPTLPVQVRLFDAFEAGTELCRGEATGVHRGHFTVPLPAACAVAVQANADVFVEVIVDSTLLGRSKLGAVPYALVAGRASAASGALEARLNTLMPPKAVVYAYLNADDVATFFDATGLGQPLSSYAGWAICNGNNGTPDLAGRFLRASATQAGATGGSDSSTHTHAIEHDHPAFTSAIEVGHTHAVPDHQHLLPIGWDSNNVFLSSTEDLLPVYGDRYFESVNRLVQSSGAASVGRTRLAITESGGAGLSGSGSEHAHDVDVPAYVGVSGPASTNDNLPSYYELIALMRL